MNPNEIQAIKTEITEAIIRRGNIDSRPPSASYSLVSVALADVLADIIFAAAKDRGHAQRLLSIINQQIEARWRCLEETFAPSTDK